MQVNSNQKYGSDFMVDVLKSLGVEYCAANTSANFLGLHESIINYGGNQGPEWLTACHEEHSVAMAQGYFKIEGKPMMILADATVGLMHASMAVYNSYADRVPVLLFLGNKRRIRTNSISDGPQPGFETRNRKGVSIFLPAFIRQFTSNNSMLNYYSLSLKNCWILFISFLSSGRSRSIFLYLR